MFAIVICLVLLMCTLTILSSVLCVLMVEGVCCGECYVVSNECDEPTSCLVQPIVAHCCEVMYYGCLALGVSLVS